jgi:hypothetical protein
MSGGVLFQESLRVLSKSGLHAIAERDVLHALDVAQAHGPLDLIYDCGFEARLERPALLTRGAAIFFSYAAGNLADDLADGECTYLAEPARTGPCVQFVLQNLFFATALRSGISCAALEEVAGTLARAGGPQLIEVRTRQWTAALARLVGESIAGLQYAAYLRLLWDGTWLEGRASDVGMALGVAGHVAKDLLTQDPRTATLSPDQAAEVVAWAKEQADSLRREGLACLEATLRHIDPILERAS